MTIQLPLTSINGTRTTNWAEFESYLLQTGRAAKTASIYRSLLAKYFAEAKFALSTGSAWLSWNVPAQEKRLTGYALRVYRQFLLEFYPEDTESFFVPKKLPAASRPDPQPLESPDKLIRKLNQVAKKVLLHDTYLSVRVFLLTLRELGVRRNEAGGIGWNDINWQEHSVVIHGKGGKDRYLPLSRRLWKLFSLLRNRSHVSPWIGSRDQILSGDVMAHLLKKVAKAAGLPSIHCHAFRSTKLTEIGNREDFNPVLFMAISGHSDISMGKYYVKASLQRMKAMMELS